MQELLKYIDSNYLLSLGEYKFSDLSRISIGLSMKYMDKLKEGTLDAKPFIFGFPNKKWATVWLSIGILNNLFYRESQNINDNWIERLGLKRNDRIEIFGKPSRWIGKKDNKWMIEVSQSAPNAYGKNEKSIIDYKLPSSWASFVNRDSSKRTGIISVKALNRELTGRRKNQTVLEKILFYSKKGKDLGLNPKTLQSKVLIITGRGDKGRFIRQLNETKIYEESLSSVFGFEKKLIVEVDLEKYKGIDDPSFDKKASFFKKNVARLLLHILQTDPHLKKEIKKLQNGLDKDDYLNESFRLEFNNLKDEVEDEKDEEKFKNLLEKHPGIKSKFDFDAVVINDVAMLEEYKNVIDSLSRMKIPVITITDFYSEFESTEIETDNYYRFFWGNSKLFHFSENEDPLDIKAWQLAKRFNDQFISIEITDDSGIEEAFSQLTRNIFDIEGYEKLKKAFWDSMFPVYHLIKNTPGSIPYDQIENLIQDFKTELKIAPLPAYQGERVKKILSLLENGFTNNKAVIEEELIFKQSITCSNKKLDLPNAGHCSNEFLEFTNSKIQKISFTGEPYKEKYTGQLKKACLSDFVKDIKIICWPKEGKKMYDYLRQNYKTKYFTDNFHQIFEIKERYRIRNSKEIDTELDEIICIDRRKYNIKRETGKINDLFDKLRAYRHSTYKPYDRDESVDANTITFTNSDWMYLPKNSSILAANYFHTGKLNIRKYKFSELTPGLQIIQYNLDREQLRRIGRNELSSVFDRLDIWRNSLENSFTKSGNDYLTLEATLNNLKQQYNSDGNPSKINLIRWRKDDELLAPNNSNLALILLADGKEELLKKVSEARKRVRKFDTYIRGIIKSEITAKLESVALKKVSQDCFEINVRGFTVLISQRTVLSKDLQSLEVSYSSTRKIISD